MSMCRVFSCVVGKGCLLWPVHSLDKTLLAFALLHSVLHRMKAKFACYSRYFLTSYFCIPVSYQSCPTLCDPMGYSPPGSFHPWNFLGKSTGVGCHFLLQGNLPDPGIKPGSPILQADALPSEAPGEPTVRSVSTQKLCSNKTLFIKYKQKGCLAPVV